MTTNATLRRTPVLPSQRPTTPPQIKIEMTTTQTTPPNQQPQVSVNPPTNLTMPAPSSLITSSPLATPLLQQNSQLHEKLNELTNKLSLEAKMDFLEEVSLDYNNMLILPFRKPSQESKNLLGKIKSLLQNREQSLAQGEPITKCWNELNEYMSNPQNTGRFLYKQIAGMLVRPKLSTFIKHAAAKFLLNALSTTVAYIVFVPAGIMFTTFTIIQSLCDLAIGAKKFFRKTPLSRAELCSIPSNLNKLKILSLEEKRNFLQTIAAEHSRNKPEKNILLKNTKINSKNLFQNLKIFHQKGRDIPEEDINTILESITKWIVYRDESGRYWYPHNGSRLFLIIYKALENLPQAT